MKIQYCILFLARKFKLTIESTYFKALVGDMQVGHNLSMHQTPRMKLMHRKDLRECKKDFLFEFLHVHWAVLQKDGGQFVA